MSGTEQSPPSQVALAAHPDIAGLGYEAAREELTAIVAKLEGGHASLEESMKLWERGEALAQHCQAWLDEAEQRLTAQEDDASD
ncbi:exodeoxyribonuclease VII small subunit [Luteipulveratus sp. YIM 133132]|uniref:Exodeoxyribonuclease 7 small subunit n=1 Tax=Luteipulveratus flavus TaxID=3031728 RepID=A0ABT6C5Y1_9MICO|nr:MULTISPECIES: exodeoxyribonuclease VII small subunit [unclassified Luteipulveratus]MDE9365314.1 exodeoxyribonuclease VII small subunit [Luteipulveratus sp. YIM 133132]MDF8264348.1 exodeoxyribonuclease VII small subunit [Luteipulveratus sp. YIM 133296]